MAADRQCAVAGEGDAGEEAGNGYRQTNLAMLVETTAKDEPFVCPDYCVCVTCSNPNYPSPFFATLVRVFETQRLRSLDVKCC